MADLFLSYSRLDGTFVRRLASALQERGKDVWVDVAGIRDGEVFPEALRRAIESSDAFVFVISPDSVHSSFCVEEVEHAAALNKRIVPIALRPVSDEDVPEQVRVRNWIPAKREGELDGTIERVVKALDTDLDWEREHSRLTVRALEWDRSRRDRSFLLRGADLRSAEAWLAAGASKEPGPTALETEYIVAGRAAATRRQRGLVALSLCGTAVAIGLLIFALISRSDAIGQALTSDAERVGAQALVEKNLDLAMLYAVTGVKLQNRLQTRSDLLAELQNNPEAIKLIRPSQDEIRSVAIDPSGKILATGDSAGIVRFEDMSRWRAIGSPVRLQGQIPIEAMAFSPHGALAVVTESGTPQGNIQAGLTRLYEIDRTTDRARLLGSWRGVIEKVPYPNASLAFSQDGRYLALAIARAAPDGSFPSDTLRLLDASTGRVIWQRSYPVRPGQSEVRLLFAPDGALVTTANQGDTLEWSAQTGRVLRRFPIGGEPAISADGKTLALAMNSPNLAAPTSRIALLNLASGHYRVLPAGVPDDWVRNLAFIAGGTEIIGDRFIGGDLEVWNVASGTVTESIAEPPGARSGEAIDPAGRTLALGAENGSVTVYDLEGSRRLGQAFQWGPPTQSCPYNPCFVVNPQSTQMATDEGDGSVALINLRTLRLTAKLPARNGVLAPALAFFPNGRTLVTGGLTGYLTFWDVDSHQVVRRIHLGEPVWWVDVSRDGRLLASQTQAQQSSSSQVQVRPAAGGKPLWTHSVPDGNGGLYFSPDGREVAALGCCTTTATVVSWDTRSGRQLFKHRLANHATAIAYTPDSRLLAVGTEDGHVLFWNARSGVEQRPPLLITAGSIGGVTFSPDSKTMVVSAADGSTTVWDLRSRTQIGNSFPMRPEVEPDPVFAPNGRLVMDYLADAEQWPMDVASWERFACQVAGRNLTHAEWQAILPDRPYMRVCPGAGAG